MIAFARSSYLILTLAAALATAASVTGCSTPAHKPGGTGGVIGNLDAGITLDVEAQDIPAPLGDAVTADALRVVDVPSAADGPLTGDVSRDTGGTGGDPGQDAAPRDSATEVAGSDGAGGSDGATPGSVVTTLDIADVWSGDPVGFALVTQGNQQFAGFYDAQQRMTIATRTLPETTWTLARLPTSVGWDSHNYITMAIDGAGFIHVSGNMHSAPLIYFRTTRPLDITSFSAAPMVGTNETSCTYPQFIHGPSGDFVYAYRDGVSGNGNYIFNVYDVPTKTWRRLINALTDGQGLRNAYPVGPSLGPDGWWHLVYVWRDTPDAATNHDLSYAKSRDLINWQSGTGQPLTLPITLATSDIVDHVPPMGGMINNNTKVGFDSQNRPVIGYHKFDGAGFTQLYNARVEGGRWVTHQTSNWNYRWNFGGGGTLIFQIQLDGVKVQSDGSLVQVWYHMQYGGWNAFRLDQTTLLAAATIGRMLPYPVALDTVASSTPGMGVRWASDTGSGPDPGIIYMLRWETLPENMDLPRNPVPPPTRLRLYGFIKRS